jgi:hypothetical protein
LAVVDDGCLGTVLEAELRQDGGHAVADGGFER